MLLMAYAVPSDAGGTGLQASPSKHAGYSVRMENAVPIVTQAPGAQPLQIQPGLLTQVRNSKGTELSRYLLYCLALGGCGEKLSLRAFCGAVQRCEQLYMGLQFSLKCRNLPHLIVQPKDYVGVAKATGKPPSLSAFLPKSVGRPQGKQCQASVEK